TMSDANVEIHCLIRSLIDSGKDYVVSMLDSLGKLAGAKTEAKSYPALCPRESVYPCAIAEQSAGDPADYRYAKSAAAGTLPGGFL
ncbi:hypothetical protein MJI69_27620, partial [Salmonella enterica subsp. enterica serovar Anatum]|nr:hypothetical protein [Salmonella enterica subsp. enterica serovar Anatum]